jgi:hypothetical protein
MMDMPNSKRKADSPSDEFKTLWKDLAEQQKRLRILQEQRELVRLQKEKALWRSASEFPKASPEVHASKQKQEFPSGPSNFFTKLRLGGLLG